jgi:hypothetical protein
MILDFSAANFDPKKYFIYSDLLEDSGIECPDEKIAQLCLLVNDSYNFTVKLHIMNLDELVDTYNFFEQYCISRGTIQLIKAVINYRAKTTLLNFSTLKCEMGKQYYRFVGDGNFSNISLIKSFTFNHIVDNKIIFDINKYTQDMNSITLYTSRRLTDAFTTWPTHLTFIIKMLNDKPVELQTSHGFKYIVESSY